MFRRARSLVVAHSLVGFAGMAAAATIGWVALWLRLDGSAHVTQPIAVGLGTASSVALAILCFALPLFLGLSWLSMRQLARPLSELERVARTITRGEIQDDWGLSGADEFARVGEAIGVMGGTIEALVRRLDEREGELQQALEELRLSERHKDEFLDVIGHELRTPLNSIIGYAELLVDEVEGPLNERQRVMAGGLRQDADRLMRQLDNLLLYSRILAGRLALVPRAVDYSEVVGCALARVGDLADAKGIRVTAKVHARNEVYLDEDRIAQVLTQLLENAIKFTPAQGQVEVHAFARGTDLVTEIRDTGIGLGGSDYPKLFRRFRQLDMSATRAAGGTGIGLAIAKSIVAAHGGEIGVNSTRDQGSIFWFCIPDALVPLAA